MSHRQVLEALSGLLLGMFVAILASTVVSTSLPRIIGDLGGGESAYTWVVTSTLLATTVTTPVWGKFADLFNRKLLIQLALVIFVLGSALAGFSQNPGTLITFRVLQGVGAGGLTALSQIIMADIISPRERGRYMGLFGAVMAVGTVGGPLFGGFLTDGLGWRWNFFVGVPFAIAAIILLQFTLKLRARAARKVKIDYLGAVLIAGGVSLLLIWVTLAGSQFGWASLATVLMVGGAVVALVLAVVVEIRAEEPILPMTLFKNRTFTLAVIASVVVGIAMFGTSVYLAQYMQLARGATPTESGLLTLPMIVGLLLSSTVVGSIISKTGKWKRYMVGGTISLVVGMFLMGTIAYDTPYPIVGVFMFLMGAGIGAVMQNLVLVVQNTTEAKNIGSASAGVAFFRSLGGTIGVSVLGTILGSRITTLLGDKQTEMTEAVRSLGAQGATVAKELASGSIPNVAELPRAVRIIVESAYGTGIANVFLIAAPIAIIAIIAVAFLPNKELTTQTVAERAAEQPGIDPASVAPGMPNQASVTAPVATAAGAGTAAEDPQDADRDSQPVGAGRAADS
ncbi:MDR family MFS transporter [Curtobacterium sp. Leaf261]|uniref:MDR family MFS transporter n=1 Tax=Curtobacterium sp. Leaf261 TaxID=1736311 RepID=UPI0009E82EC7|nr:MDR family MFS transporter [Curtobacterium sp. Leaf261]